MKTKLERAIEKIHSHMQAAEYDIKSMSSIPPDWWPRITRMLKFERFTTYSHCLRILEDLENEKDNKTLKKTIKNM